MQRSSQDVRRDPHFQHPSPHYSQIQQHRKVQQTTLVEVNEMGLTIQQGVIQRPVQRRTQPTGTGTRPKETGCPSNITHGQYNNNGSVRLDTEENRRDRLPECEEDPSQGDYVLNYVHERIPFSLNNVARPVFVNHYYAGGPPTPVTGKKTISLDECDVSTKNSAGNQQSQVINREPIEHSRNSLGTQWQIPNEKTNASAQAGGQEQ